ncbi:hypothetical protein C5167_039063 [Papaver somniferum]|uniref:Uncharacterized protein n=1 Tax=Papaver somniferum TaxID=3469 RepID=A0A4Y7IB22_PAPSO|nr:hypothetical protein C5167_039063 [Papaver somniferum]
MSSRKPLKLSKGKALRQLVDALRKCSGDLKNHPNGRNGSPGICIFLNTYDVDKTMDEINEHTENMKQVHEALSNPVRAAADFDEEELESELEELEEAELEEQVLQLLAQTQVQIMVKFSAVSCSLAFSWSSCSSFICNLFLDVSTDSMWTKIFTENAWKALLDATGVIKA